MLVPLSVSALWLLGMLAAAAHIQDGGRTPANGLRAMFIFAAVVPLALGLAPQPNWTAVLLAGAAFWRLIAGPMPRAGGLLAGTSAGLVAALQIASGLSWALTLAVSALGLACAFFWASGPARPGRWDWIVVAAALAIPPAGLAADIVYGWQSAAVLNSAVTNADAAQLPVWAIALLGAALLAGLARGIWTRR